MPKMRMFNLDGSEGKMCGNAIRCVGKYLYDNGHTDKTELDIETLSGIKHLSLSVTEGKVSLVTVDMGYAVLRAAEIPVVSESETVTGFPLSVCGTEYRITCVSMGNPHAVTFVPAHGYAGFGENRSRFRAPSDVSGESEYGIYRDSGQEQSENARVGTRKRRNMGVRHRRLRRGHGCRCQRILRCGKARDGASDRRQAHHHGEQGFPCADDRRGDKSI